MSESLTQEIAEAMKVRRRELIEMPLDRIWLELAKAAQAAIAFRASELEMVKALIERDWNGKGGPDLG